MAKATCAISGIKFEVAMLRDLDIPHTAGYYHPIFRATHKQLYELYYKHTRGKLIPTDSYMLFLAFLESSGQVRWDHPVTLGATEPATNRIVENNMRQLIAVLEKSAMINSSAFSQPSFVVSYDNSRLSQIANWIEAWEDNITEYKEDRADNIQLQALAKVEHRLSYLILSGESAHTFAHVIADWANRAAGFPEESKEVYIAAIKNCFNSTKMFNTPLVLLKEIKDYCECNIAAGSIHFHTLIQVLKEGIHRHLDYLGSDTARGYLLLPTLEAKENATAAAAKNTEQLEAIIATAPTTAPVAIDYKTNMDFIRAKLAYRVSLNKAKTESKLVEEQTKLANANPIGEL